MFGNSLDLGAKRDMVGAFLFFIAHLMVLVGVSTVTVHFLGMVGVVEGFRWALLGTDTAPGPIIAVSSLVAIGLLVGGAFYFRRMEKTFADVV